MKRIALLVLFSSLLVSCAPVTSSPTSIVNVSVSSATQPFLDELFTCADASSATLNLTSASPDLTLRLALPDEWAGLSFQVAAEDILIVVSVNSPIPALTRDQARTIFAGQGDPSVQVWSYASAEETRGAFESALMDGRSVTSFARLAVSPSHMLEALTSDPNAIGILPRSWMNDQLRELHVAATVPVLALTPTEPEGAIRELIACMQQ